MVHADHARFGNARRTHRDIFKIDRRHPFAAGFDHILGAIDNLHVAQRIERGDIASIEPAIGREGAEAFALEIAADNPRPAHQQPAERLAIARQLLIIVVHDLHLDAENAAALLDPDVELLIIGQGIGFRDAGAHRAERGHFGHAPQLQHFHAELVIAFEHRARHRRTTDRRPVQLAEGFAGFLQILHHAQPDGRHGQRKINLFLDDQLVQGWRIEVRAAHHQLRAAAGRRIGDGPGIGVIHGRDGQHCGARAHAECVGGARCHGVQHIGPMAILHALGIAGGAAGVAQAGRRGFRHLGPRRIHALQRQQLFVAE